jgi:hypothetical protein
MPLHRDAVCPGPNFSGFTQVTNRAEKNLPLQGNKFCGVLDCSRSRRFN